MVEMLKCDLVVERELIERYAAGTLAARDEAALEAHYLTCGRCQRKVRLALAIHDVAGKRPAPASAAGRRARPARHWRAVVMAGLAAASVVGVALWSASTPSPYADLGRVIEPPIYLGVPVRERDRSGDSLFAAAMTAYAERRFDEAASVLDHAVAAGVDSVPAIFFHASSQLMLGQHRAAADGFARVLAMGESPYRGEAAYLRAKALLREGRAEEALAMLAAAGGARTMPGLARSARALADSVDARLQR